MNALYNGMEKKQEVMRMRFLFVVSVGAWLIMGIAGAQETAVKMSMDDKAIAITATGQPLLTYCFDQVPFKPYAQTFFTPAGVNILRDSPHDHKHHHALMFAVAADDINFWEETEGCGKQVHRRFSDTRMVKTDNAPWASFTEDIDWLNPKDNSVVLTEKRTVEATQLGDPKVSVIRWHTRLEVPAGKAKVALGGHHYYGLGMRFVQSMDPKGTFRMAGDAKGEIVRGDEQLTNAPWCAYTAEAEGKPVTVAMFDHPENPRVPAKWFTMHTPFAYLSATSNLWKEPLEATAEKPLVFQYCVALWDGNPDTGTIEAFNKRWLGWPAPEQEQRLN